MNSEIAQAILAYADATKMLAAAIERLASGGIGLQQASEPLAPPAAEMPAAEPKGKTSAKSNGKAKAAEPKADFEPEPESPKKVKLTTEKTWTNMPPTEVREKCKDLIMRLVNAGRQQDIVRCLDSVDSSRLNDVPDLAMPSLFVALEVAIREAHLGED